MRRKRVLLLNPKTVNKYYHTRLNWTDALIVRFFRRFYDRTFNIASHGHCTTVPPITLLGLQALFDGRCETLVVDEQVDDIDFDINVDLVCVTATTPQIKRAVEISRRFQARGIRTAIGGIHATCLPDECAQHFDTVCIGEAEGYIDELSYDLQWGTLKPRYRNRRTVSMEEVPFYRYDVGGGKYLPFHVISFSRGCVFDCEYCSIRSTQGPFRTRPIDAVVREIEDAGIRNLWFPDATLTANPRKARELFRALIPLKVRWLSQISLNVASDEAMLDLMAESGCWLVSIGFESLSQASVTTARKVQNRVEDYGRVIEALHKRKISIEGNFVFGFDEDYEDVFERTAGFIVEHGIDLPELYVLTPYPDTALYRRLLEEGRIVDHDWSHYDNTHFQHLPVFQPSNMSRETLRGGCLEAERTVYSVRNTLKRLIRARVLNVPVLLANYVYGSRIVKRNNLVPVESAKHGTVRQSQQRETPSVVEMETVDCKHQQCRSGGA